MRRLLLTKVLIRPSYKQKQPELKQLNWPNKSKKRIRVSNKS